MIKLAAHNNSCGLDFFQQAIKRKSIFKQNDALEYTYIPERLFMRNDAMESLIFTFRRILSEKNISTNCLLTGPPGSGKTVTAQFFAKNFREIALERMPNFYIEYYNCIEFRSKVAITRDLVKKYCHSSGRGYSFEEWWVILLKYLISTNSYFFIILDEVYNIPQEDIFRLLHLSETFGHDNVRISFLLISREKEWIQYKNVDLLSRLCEIIKIEPYNFKQAYTLLSNRCEIGFKENVICEDILSELAQLVVKTKNMRYGIDLLRKLGLFADKKGIKKVTLDMIDKVSRMPYLKYEETFSKLKFHELLCYSSMFLALANTKTTPIENVYCEYEKLCEKFDKAPYVIMTVRKYLRNLRKVNLLYSKYVSLSKGRYLLYYLPDNINEFKQEIETYLNWKYLNEE